MDAHVARSARRRSRSLENESGVERVTRGEDRVFRSNDAQDQTNSSPFVRLNVLAVQKLAALRYHTWYVRVPGVST